MMDNNRAVANLNSQEIFKIPEKFKKSSEKSRKICDFR